MPIAIETVIIIIVVISFTILAGIVFALYWLWRLLLEDRRCSRLQGPPGWPHRPPAPHPNWQGYTPVIATSSSHQHRDAPDLLVNADSEDAPLTTPRNNLPRITRGNDVIVDERRRRMARGKRTPRAPSGRVRHVRPAPLVVEVPTTVEVVVLDGTEPPPPYEDGR